MRNNTTVVFFLYIQIDLKKIHAQINLCVEIIYNILIVSRRIRNKIAHTIFSY